MTHKHATTIFIILIVFALGITVLALVTKEPGQKTQTNRQWVGDNSGGNTPASNTSDNDEEPDIIDFDMNTNAWETYRNEELGFSFEYPRAWGQVFLEKFSNNNLVITPNLEDKQSTRLDITVMDSMPQKSTWKELVVIEYGYGCNMLFSNFFELSDDIYLLVTNPKPLLTENECLVLYNTFPKSRRQAFGGPDSGGITRIFLKEEEFPQNLYDQYVEFKRVVSSFKEI